MSRSDPHVTVVKRTDGWHWRYVNYRDDCISREIFRTRCEAEQVALTVADSNGIICIPSREDVRNAVPFDMRSR